MRTIWVKYPKGENRYVFNTTNEELQVGDKFKCDNTKPTLEVTKIEDEVHTHYRHGTTEFVKYDEEDIGTHNIRMLENVVIIKE